MFYQFRTINRNVPNILLPVKSLSIIGIKSRFSKQEDMFVLAIGPIKGGRFGECIPPIPDDVAAQSPTSILQSKSHFPGDTY